MRYLLMCSAFTLAAIIGLAFLEEGEHQLPFEDRRVIVLSGGRGGGAFYDAVEQGAIRAYRDLGCSIRLASTTWDPAEVRTIFQQEMAGAPDAICIVGDPHDAQLMPLIESAIEGGTVVTTYHREMRQAQERFSAEGFGFAGPDLYRAGQSLIDAAVKKHRLARGAVVLLLHDPEQQDDDGLYGGTIAALQAHGLVVELIEISRGDPDAVENALLSTLKTSTANGREPALVCSLYASLESCLRALKTSGIASDRLPLVGIHIGSDFRGVGEAGKTHLSMLVEEDIPLQAYLAILQSCLGKKYAAVGTRVLTPFSVVDCEVPRSASPRQPTANFIQRF